MILAALYHLEWHALNDHSLRSEEVFGLMTKLVLLINLKLRHGVFLNLSYNWWKCSWVKKHVFFFIPTQGHAHWPQREGREGEREGEKHPCKRETSPGCLVASQTCPDPGPNLQPRDVSGQQSNLWPSGLWDNTPVNWITPARAKHVFFNR